MLDPHLEEQAYRYAFGRLPEAEAAELFRLARENAELAEILDDYTEIGTAFATDGPQVAPPPELRSTIFGQLEPQPLGAISPPKILAFPTWLPWAIAAALAVVCLGQGYLLLSRRPLGEGAAASLAATSGIGPRHSFQAVDPAFATVQASWQWRGSDGIVLFSAERLPPPPARHDYQLWAIPPGQAPVSAGLVTITPIGQLFAEEKLAPGTKFAVSIEPLGGSPAPTGPIVLTSAE